ncbi:hypothetical protein [Rubrolithibacter danxiaensis]|uniref:hypothetical protein n=1 Tax=Rubrolithibacter danxiaensis TaxID=3390805 RepID=UPI003BF7A6E3
MKKQLNSVSPFIILLIPIFLGMALIFVNSDNTIPKEKYNASTSFRLPTLKVAVKAIF